MQQSHDATLAAMDHIRMEVNAAMVASRLIETDEEKERHLRLQARSDRAHDVAKKLTGSVGPRTGPRQRVLVIDDYGSRNMELTDDES